MQIRNNNKPEKARKGGEITGGRTDKRPRPFASWYRRGRGGL